MATKSISQLDTQAIANETDLFEVAIVDANSASGYASKKESGAAIADAIVGEYQYPLRITGTTAKTIAGAINELKNLVDLLPQFAIEVVQALPVSDISETTIYLVPASDPEQGNYYEEYIYVNNAWELVGTTAVDLSGYYTSAQVDTLLAAKANTSSLATVATSGAYSDLTGKPTIDTALDTTSTNAVENRAVAGAINSIESDLQDKADIITNSASGAIASFSDGADNLPVKDLTINITAVQAGSGDPSPTNVRPISGWTGATINVSGEDTSDPTTYNINWQSTAGTIYGGTLDVTTGVLTVECVSMTFDGSVDETVYFVGTSSPTAPEDFTRFALEISSDSITITGDNTLTGLLWSNMYVENTNLNTFNGAHGIHFRVNGSHQVVVADAKSVIGSTVEQFRTFLSTKNLQVVYALETPVTYQFTPTEVKTLLGQNNIWADTGDSSVSYRADTKKYIDAKIAELQALILNS